MAFEQNIDTTTKNVNKSVIPKANNDFYVYFIGLEGNNKNILSGFTKACSRPSLSFRTYKEAHLKKQINQFGVIEYDPITIQLIDDENSLVKEVIYRQIIKQAHFDTRFNIVIEVYNTRDEKTEEYVLRDCFFSKLSYETAMMDNADNQDIVMTLFVQYDSLYLGGEIMTDAFTFAKADEVTFPTYLSNI